MKVLISMGLRVTIQSWLVVGARPVVFASARGIALVSAAKRIRSMSSFQMLPANPVSPAHSTDKPDENKKNYYLFVNTSQKKTVNGVRIRSR
jgi:hypothetical protein